ncbi:MAG: 2-oxoacid:acceptor oxidoreductase subunit alpha [Candidatus Dojkabacteria bacterium]
MSSQRISVKFVGQSGQGINTVGKIFSKALSSSSYYVFASREYPSLIKGGIASYQIDFSFSNVHSSSKYVNILCAFSKESLLFHLETVSENALVIYDTEEQSIEEAFGNYTKKKHITLLPLDTKKIALENGGTEIMSNIVILGLLAKIIGIESTVLDEEVDRNFKNKKIDMLAQKKCIEAGYTSALFRPEYAKSLLLKKPFKIIKSKKFLITGNEAVGLGAISAGVRAYYAYPMTPATSIFKFLADTSEETGILLKQAENEITAVQMAMGSMYMGTRALVATSGGGFDLMVETTSCAGMTENPLVIILSQRAGAGTGLATWSGSGDLTTAVKSGHGEFPKCVLAMSDVNSCYTLTQEAMNIAEKYQLPVILLADKHLSESLFTSEDLPKSISINRSFSSGENRYQLSDDGLSPRWLPSSNKKPYLMNSDEHLEDGSSNDDFSNASLMTEKRMKKMKTLEKEVPEPKYYGNINATNLFVGWGSVKNSMLDLLKENKDLGYLHYEYIFPLKTKFFENLIHKKGKNIILIENNYDGQLGRLIKESTGYDFEKKLLKYDGRPFTVNDILDYLDI